jgi:hypothetical protein
MNEACDRCGPAVCAMYHADREGELYLCGHCADRLSPALSAQGWSIGSIGEHALAPQRADYGDGRVRAGWRGTAETRADLILADGLSIEAYGHHFETQVHRGRIRQLLYASYRHLARAGAGLAGLNAGPIW